MLPSDGTAMPQKTGVARPWGSSVFCGVHPTALKTNKALEYVVERVMGGPLMLPLRITDPLLLDMLQRSGH